MKKLCPGALLLCALLLCACQSTGNQEDQQAASYQEAMAKAQAIQIQDAAGQTVDTLSKPEEIETFLEELDLGHWTYQEAAPQTQPLGTFVFIEESTIKLGQTEPDGWMEICRILCYPEDTITLEILGLSLPFTLEEAAWETLAARLPA